MGAGDSWLEIGLLILIWIWSLLFDTPMIQILADLELLGMLEGLDWGFGSWIVIWVWLLVHDAYMCKLVILYPDFWSAKNILYWGFFEDLEVPDKGLGFWFWYGWRQCFLYTIMSANWGFLRMMVVLVQVWYLGHDLGMVIDHWFAHIQNLRDTGGLWLWLGIYIMIWDKNIRL